MIEVPLDGENSNDNDDVVSVSQSCRGRHNQYGLSPRQLRLLQAERRRRAAAAASSSSATAATDNSPKLDTSAECNNDDGVSLIPSPIATRYSTPPRETLSLPSSSFCHGSSNKPHQHQQPQHKNFGFGSGSNSGASIAELTDATTTTSTTTLSTHVEDSIQRRKLQLKHISSSSTTSTLATNHTVGNNDNEHTNSSDSVIPVNKGNDESGREEAEVTNSERVKVSERIRAFNGRGSSVGAIVGRARWSNSNAAITTGGRLYESIHGENA